VYVQEGLRWRPLSVLVGLLIVFTGLVSAATIANGFVGYLHVFVPAVPSGLAVTLLVAALGVLAAWGISESVWVAVFITLVEVGGLLLVLAVAGGGGLSALPARWPEFLPPWEAATWHGILLGAFLAFYAFIGFEDMVNVAEEVKDPSRVLPKAILWAIILSTVLYLAVALVAVLALPPPVLAASAAPLALLYEHTTGDPPTLISAISLFAVVNGALVQIIMAARVLYGMSREGWLPAAFGRVNAYTRTPLFATGVITAMVLALALALPLVTLAKATSYVILIVFSLVNLALVFLKRRDPHPRRGVRVYPFWIPVAGFAASAGMVVFQTISALRG
jgi:amino acid transporter